MRPKTKLVDLAEVLDTVLPSGVTDRLNKLDSAAERIEQKYFTISLGQVVSLVPNEDEVALFNFLMGVLRLGKQDVMRRALVDLYRRVRAEQKKKDVNVVKV